MSTGEKQLKQNVNHAPRLTLSQVQKGHAHFFLWVNMTDPHLQKLRLRVVCLSSELQVNIIRFPIFCFKNTPTQHVKKFPISALASFYPFCSKHTKCMISLWNWAVAICQISYASKTGSAPMPLGWSEIFCHISKLYDMLQTSVGQC